MKIGLGSHTFGWAVGIPGYASPRQPMQHQDIVARAVALGARVVQFADNLPLHSLSPQDLVSLLRAAENAGLQVEVGTRGIAPEHLRRYLAIAQACQSPILRVVVDTADHHPSPPEIVDLLRPLLPEFAAVGVTLAIENHDRFSAHTLADIIRALDSSAVGICLDTVNSFGALEGPDTVLAALAPYVVNVHIKDFRVARLDHNMGFSVTGTPAGQGMLAIPDLFARFAGRDLSGILELWTPYQGDVEASIALEAAWAAQSMAYLRGISST